jgi:hypothetical protein
MLVQALNLEVEDYINRHVEEVDENSSHRYYRRISESRRRSNLCCQFYI